MRRFALLALGLLLAPRAVLAQDMNYSSFQAGGRSALMGGAVVGGVRDSSAVVYNPGALGFVRDTGVSVSGTAFQYGRLKASDVFGPGRDADADLVDVVPLLISGSLRLGDRATLGYGLARGQQFSASFRGAVVPVAEVGAPPPAGDETFIGQFDDTRKVEETWGM